MNSFSKQKPVRIEWIDFGKGLTVLMVVFGHPKDLKITINGYYL